ncbi:Josephin-1 [Entomortierella chlamydospora]|uniref:ubiquitinyl hydrolase 1 n=1 Tax=Entomortierella chlamydospora TaxID=101097 RepID=A0A9P6MU93_9FUNG|nr:Josephin-1 [Entomortierella chlamydospora]KAG0012951.1 Josephin-1 [Entomortierella chlamydospora]
MAQITSTRSLYHECQSQGQCGKHTLNNLLQGPIFSTADLDVIAENLRQIAQESLQKTIWKNPYKSPMGMGYYDVSVLEAALNQQQCTLSWFDARRDIAECLAQQDSSMVGLIVHVPTTSRWIPFWKGQHWFGILRLSNGAFIDMDSRLSQPTAFEGFEDTIRFVNDVLQNGGRLFLIHRTGERPEGPNSIAQQTVSTSTAVPGSLIAPDKSFGLEAPESSEST